MDRGAIGFGARFSICGVRWTVRRSEIGRIPCCGGVELDSDWQSADSEREFRQKIINLRCWVEVGIYSLRGWKGTLVLGSTLDHNLREWMDVYRIEGGVKS